MVCFSNTVLEICFALLNCEIKTHFCKFLTSVNPLLMDIFQLWMNINDEQFYSSHSVKISFLNQILWAAGTVNSDWENIGEKICMYNFCKFFKMHCTMIKFICFLND